MKTDYSFEIHTNGEFIWNDGSDVGDSAWFRDNRGHPTTLGEDKALKQES